MPLTLQISDMFSEMPKGRGVLPNVKGAKDLMKGLGLQTPSGKGMRLQPCAATRDRDYFFSCIQIRYRAPCVMPELHSMHDALSKLPEGQCQGAEGNNLALKKDSGTMVNVFCSLLAHN